MKFNNKIYLLLIPVILVGVLILKSRKEVAKVTEDLQPDILAYEINPRTDQIHFYHKDDKGEPFKNHKNLKHWLKQKNKQLLFAMNGGMYKKDLSPQGLYIENGKLITPLDRQMEGYGNFYLQPNGVLSINKNQQANIISTVLLEDISIQDMKYATQSGPMLVINDEIHPKFREGSSNLHIRNGVGLLPNGNLLFAMSKQKINFYSFAKFFQKQHCQNALYLDGFVSRTYLPAKEWIQEDGHFAIIIAQVEE